VADRPAFSHRRERRGLIGPFGGRQLLLGAIAVVASAVVLVIVTTPLGSSNGLGLDNPEATQFVLGPKPTNGLQPGQLPPELMVTGANGSPSPLLDLDGKPVQLAALRGKAVWLNFWASWCPPCQSETPILRDLADRYRARGLVVVGVSVQESSADNVRAYARRYQLGYTIAADVTGAVYAAYRLNGIPSSFFIGPEGAIRSIVLAPLTEARAVAQIEAILDGSSPSPTPSRSPSSSPGSSPMPSAS
jgi:cytochrome c biogenesis protein CcmG/thiol:disulfide interchange protein DsbE